MIDEAWADSLIFGAMNTIEVIERLLVCDGQPKRGFRDSIFHVDFKQCGVATGPHSKMETSINLQYVSKLLKEGEMMTMNLTNADELTPDILNALKKQGFDQGNIKIDGKR
jgi:hypothetical protein